MASSRATNAVAGPFARLRPSPRLLSRLAGRIRRGRLALVLPDGTTQTFEGPEPSPLRGAIEIRRLRALRRLVTGGSTGFAEAYMDGEWTSPDLTALLQLAAANKSALGGVTQGFAATRLYDRVLHLANGNSRRGSRHNIAYHYDLGNTFYAHWLDPGMTYSSGMFEHPGESLADAQTRKYRRLAEGMRLAPGHHVLEIGCGWGGFALYLAREHGCRVTAATLSRQQWAYARERVREAGLEDRIEIAFRDYRDLTGTYDRIASIEMFEAVGQAYWPAFFEVVRERLSPGGVAGLQIITISDDCFEDYRKGADFIQRYIFPGGMLPSPSALAGEIGRGRLHLTHAETFGESYALTLAAWQQRFQRAWPAIEALGYSLPFKRMWEFYLAYCEAGFRFGPLDVGHYIVERP